MSDWLGTLFRFGDYLEVPLRSDVVALEDDAAAGAKMIRLLGTPPGARGELVLPLRPGADWILVQNATKACRIAAARGRVFVDLPPGSVAQVFCTSEGIVQAVASGADAAALRGIPLETTSARFAEPLAFAGPAWSNASLLRLYALGNDVEGYVSQFAQSLAANAATPVTDALFEQPPPGSMMTVAASIDGLALEADEIFHADVSATFLQSAAGAMTLPAGAVVQSNVRRSAGAAGTDASLAVTSGTTAALSVTGRAGQRWRFVASVRAHVVRRL